MCICRIIVLPSPKRLRAAIPAFLCRQTDLVVAAAETGRALNIKKGQFLAPWDMANVVKKAEAAGNDRVMVCERGFVRLQHASFRHAVLPIMAQTGYPVVYDATHSVQQPGGEGNVGGQREFVPVLARAAYCRSCRRVHGDHENPDITPSDGPNMVPLGELSEILKTLVEIDRIAKADPVKI